MGKQAGRAVLYSFFGIGEIASAGAAKAVQRAITEQAVEGIGIGTGVAGEILTIPVLEKIIVCHKSLLTAHQERTETRDTGPEEPDTG